MVDDELDDLEEIEDEHERDAFIPKKYEFKPHETAKEEALRMIRERKQLLKDQSNQ